MKSPTEPYEKLKLSLQKIREILCRVPDNECITQLHHLKVQSFILLSHAAFEQYIEDLVTLVCKEACSQLKSQNRVCRTILSLITSEVMMQLDENIARRKIKVSVATELLDFALSAQSNFIQDVRKNNGISTHDQRKLLLPIGIDPENLDLGVSAALNAYGTKRGDVAHKYKIKTEETRSSLLSETDEILKGLLAFDKAACAKLSEGMLYKTFD